ncbi:glycosyltransferase family 2 protein [Acetivibrio cellulolyticus]|uniref:glycosyltransferase family 2 protein n=1 Tax=Acetivibrio cellulolyticus TaxID=35830 RepID=UPI001F336FD6|nr:glycosyltransferase family 2 protein [Acetivibrio cellulolyticus]
MFVVILNYKGLEDTIECIESLKKVKSKYNVSLVVVDNASGDGSDDGIKDRFDDIIMIESEANLGYSGGNNLGIRYAIEHEADYVIIINNDTIVEEDFIDGLVVNYDKDTGMCAPIIYYYDNKDDIWSSGGKYFKFKGSYSMTKGKIDKPTEFDFASGCCFLVSRNILERVGLLPEEYFLYLEDTDFCYNIRKKGLKIKVVPQSKIYHKVSKSTGGKSPLNIYYSSRNKLIFILKNFEGIKRTYAFLVNYIIRIFRMIQYFLLREKKLSRAVLWALKDYKKIGKSTRKF